MNKKGVGVRRSKEVMVGGGFERTSHVASKRLKGCGVDESLKGWVSSGVGTDVGDAGWEEGVAEAKE